MLRFLNHRRLLAEPSNTINSLLRLSHSLATRNDTTTYMPIICMSKEGQERNERQIFYDHIKSLPTVEEKLYELALQQRHKEDKFTISSVPATLAAVPFNSYITRTHVVDGLPENFTRMNVDRELNEIKRALCEELRRYYLLKDLRSEIKDEESGTKLFKNLVSQCYKKLALKNDYILQSTLQSDVRVDSFWWHGGFKSKENLVYEKNLILKYQDFPSFTIRVKDPLLPILPMDHSLCATAEVPDYNFQPPVLGIPCEPALWSTSVPGYWPGDCCEFPFLLVYPLNRLNRLLKDIEKYDIQKIENSCGVISSFGWLHAVATYLGFTPFHDIAYPLVTHAILTNGQDWKFFVYQMNTIALHEDVDLKNRCNICWTSEKMRLFDAVEDGQVKGINDEVFKTLLKFLLNGPVKRADNLKPHLGEDARSDMEKLNMRWFFRRMYSQAPDPNAHKEEIPHWRQIYKLHPEAPPAPYLRDY